jgi:hypothetical protein
MIARSLVNIRFGFADTDSEWDGPLVLSVPFVWISKFADD